MPFAPVPPLPASPRDPLALLETMEALQRRVAAATDEAHAADRLGATQVRFVRVLGANPGISQVELARATGTAPTLTGRLLRTLLKRGLVQRRRSSDDRREYLLELGLGGQRMRRRIEEARLRLARRALAPLGAKDRREFDRIAAKLLAALDDPSSHAPSKTAPSPRRPKPREKRR